MFGVFSCRGQVIRVRAPWIKHYYNADGKFYIIPNLDTVVLGGTLNHNSWDTSISQEVCTTPTVLLSWCPVVVLVNSMAIVPWDSVDSG